MKGCGEIFARFPKPTQFPTHDWYMLETVNDDKGNEVYKNVKTVATDRGDPYASECKM